MPCGTWDTPSPEKATTNRLPLDEMSHDRNHRPKILPNPHNFSRVLRVGEYGTKRAGPAQGRSGLIFSDSDYRDQQGRSHPCGSQPTSGRSGQLNMARGRCSRQVRNTRPSWASAGPAERPGPVFGHVGQRPERSTGPPARRRVGQQVCGVAASLRRQVRQRWCDGSACGSRSSARSRWPEHSTSAGSRPPEAQTLHLAASRRGAALRLASRSVAASLRTAGPDPCGSAAWWQQVFGSQVAGAQHFGAQVAGAQAFSSQQAGRSAAASARKSRRGSKSSDGRSGTDGDGGSARGGSRSSARKWPERKPSAQQAAGAQTFGAAAAGRNLRAAGLRWQVGRQVRA